MSETWIPVRGYEGLYEVSNLGQVRSLDHMVTQISTAGKPFERLVRGRLRKPVLAKEGYLSLILSNGSSRKLVRVHRLVAEAFLPKGSGNLEVNHIDGDKTNNAVENLEWVSRSENIRHRYDVLKERKPRKLSDEQVKQIRSSRETTRALAHRYRVCDSTIHKARNGFGSYKEVI